MSLVDEGMTWQELFEDIMREIADYQKGYMKIERLEITKQRLNTLIRKVRRGV